MDKTQVEFFDLQTLQKQGKEYISFFDNNIRQIDDQALPLSDRMDELEKLTQDHFPELFRILKED